MRSYTKFLLILAGLISIAFSEPSNAQTKYAGFSIQGQLIDSASGRPASWATVRLLNNNAQNVKSTTADSTGKFRIGSIPAGRYSLNISQIGYQDNTLRVDLEDTLKAQTDLGMVRIRASAAQLKGVEVRAIRPLVKQETDRLVYDVQADPDSRGNSVLEMMRKVPFVSLDGEQNLLLKNSTGFRIFINGRPSGMVEHNPREVLRSMPAATIEKIEVITNPPARYDAEGFAGIINIMMTKKTADGYNGTLNANVSLPAGGPGLGGSFNFKAGKFNASVFTGASYNEVPATTQYLQRNAGDGSFLDQSGQHKSSGKTGYAGTEISYEISEVQLLSAQFNANRNWSDAFQWQQSALTQNGALMQGYRLENVFNGNNDNIEASVNYQLGSRTSKARAFTFSYRYADYENENGNRLALSELVSYPYSGFRQNNEAGTGEHTLQADYVDKFGELGLEAGIKSILRSNNSHFTYSSAEVTRNDFKPTQDVYAAYTSLAYKFGKWGVKAGVRAEQTIVGGDIGQDYLNVVPSLSIGTQLSDKHNLNFGFSQRLKRPGINRLNPFTDRSNPNAEFTGNPALRPSTINNVMAGYNLNGKLSVNLGLTCSFFNNLDFRIVTYDEATKVTRSTYANVGKGKALTADLYLNYTLGKKASLSFNGNLALLDVSAKNEIVPPTEGAFHNFTFTGSYRPLAVWRLSGNVNVVGRSPSSRSFQSFTASLVNTSFTSSHELIKDKLDFTVTLNNPFSKFRTLVILTEGSDFTERSSDQSYLRAYRFSLNYKFGKLKEGVKKTRRGIRNDDVSN
ncbi:outer membrane beta-barrel protein [Pedobacter sp. JY14-1]|uniref:outer membrane beta-barrel protein n=1 Tax=Pedobacter sp. JY14-1 TaxID=3034151 RepID=UPI0023E0E981|nr:outer membrane beta-barrel protein [Pedobacter sp. JY14-1]